MSEKINIKPGVQILSVLNHLNYKTWFALAEFVDNSLQSYIKNKNELKRLDPSFKLKVEINICTDKREIRIKDNAAGICEEDFKRAFKPAEIPPDRTGLSEFGMGMKSASCWFAKQWRVETSPLMETERKIVNFDVEKIVNYKIEELDVIKKIKEKEEHGTEIILINLHKDIASKTKAKIKDHLGSIYRIFLRKNVLDLVFDNEEIYYEEPKILKAPFYKDKEKKIIEWKKDFNFDFGDGLRATGFAAIRDVASTSKSGFSLFRRNRVIEGSGSDNYRPEFIFKKSNSFTYQRVFGEIHLEGFEVSHTKDGFRWSGNDEEAFLELLKEKLDSEEKPLLMQAEKFRKKRTQQDIDKDFKDSCDESLTKVKEDLENKLNKVNFKKLIKDKKLDQLTFTNKKMLIEFEFEKWSIDIQFTKGENPLWLDMEHYTEDGVENLKISISLRHPFTDEYIDQDNIEAPLRIAVALCIGEILYKITKDKSENKPENIRNNMNRILKDALWGNVNEK